MRTNFINQQKDDKEKSFWATLTNRLGLNSMMTKMAKKVDIDRPREIVKEGLVISYKPSGEYTIKLGHKADIIVSGIAKQEKELHHHINTALSYLKSMSPKVAKELNRIEAAKRDILVYKDIDRCRDCAFYENDTSHETYKDKCKNCLHATLGGEIENYFPRGQQIVVFTPNWEQSGDAGKKVAFQGTMSLLDVHKKGEQVDGFELEDATFKVIERAKAISALGLGTALMQYFAENKINFHKHARKVIESIEKESGIQMHIRDGENILIAMEPNPDIDVVEHANPLNPEVMTEEEKDAWGEIVRKKLEGGFDLTNEEQQFLDSWLLVYPEKKVVVAVLYKRYKIAKQSDKVKTATDFGSVTWQDDQIKKVNEKKARGEELNESDKAFLETQSEHNLRGTEGMPRASSKKKNTEEAEAHGALCKPKQDALEKWEKATDRYPKSKDIMPKGSSFAGTLCLAETKKSA